MSSQRMSLYEYSKLVERVLDKQQDYFNAKRTGNINAPQILKAARKLEKELKAVTNRIQIDNSLVQQASIFEQDYRPQLMPGYADPCMIAHHYGETVEIEWLNEDRTDWISTSGKVNARTVMMAENGRVRNLKYSEQLSEIGNQEGGSNV